MASLQGSLSLSCPDTHPIPALFRSLHDIRHLFCDLIVPFGDRGSLQKVRGELGEWRGANNRALHPGCSFASFIPR